MKRENAMARQQAASKATPAIREKTSVLKQGPLAPGQRKDSQQVLQRFTQAEDDEEIIEDVSRGQQRKMAVPAQPTIPSNKIKLAPGQNKALPTLGNVNQKQGA